MRAAKDCLRFAGCGKPAAARPRITFLTRTFDAQPPEGNLVLGDDDACGQIPDFMRPPLHPQRKIRYRTAAFTKKMRVFREVGAVARRLAMMMDMFDQAAFRQGFQAVINRRQRNRRHARFHPKKHFDRRWMIAFRHESIVDPAALLGETEPLFGNPLVV